MAFTPFMVAPSATGVSKYLKPWLQPEDALVDMQDCYTYRGAIQKRFGFSLLNVFQNAVGIFNPVGVVGDGTTTTFDFTIPNISIAHPIGRFSFTITSQFPAGTTLSGKDDGVGNLTGGNIAGGSTINYTTGAIHVVFTNAPALNTPIHMTYGEEFAVGNGTTGPYSGTLAHTKITTRSVFISAWDGAEFESSPPFESPDALSPPVTGNLANTSPPDVTSGTITYSTGAITGVNVTNAIPNPNSFWAKYQYVAPIDVIKGIKFFWNSLSSRQTIIFNNKQAALVDSVNFRFVNITGNDFWTTTANNFFVVANYQGKAWIVNNTDRLTVYDGTNVYQPIVSFVNSVPTHNDLTTALGVVLYKNRLVLIRPFEGANVQPQRVRYSALNNPFNWASDVQGAGGFIDAPTPEWIISWEFLHDELIVNFQESTWRLRYTGVDTAPYRWEKINDTRLVDSPYANVGYNSWITSVGNTGLLKCDGVNTERYDDKIIDFTKEEISQQGFQLCYGYRNDLLNQQYIAYPASEDEVETANTKWLCWNFLENSFSEFNIFASCFGSYYNLKDLAWQDFNASNNLDYSWDDFEDQNWLYYFSQQGSKIPLFGTVEGEVMQLNGFVTDNGTLSGFSFTTKQFNPYIKDGQMAVLGYVDFYFDNPKPDVAPDPNYLISIDYYCDEQKDAQFTLVLNPSLDDWKFKRIFINNNAQFHQFRVYLSDDQLNGENGSPVSTVTTKGFVCNGYILWFKPGGRLTG